MLRHMSMRERIVVAALWLALAAGLGWPSVRAVRAKPGLVVQPLVILLPVLALTALALAVRTLTSEKAGPATVAIPLVLLLLVALLDATVTPHLGEPGPNSNGTASVAFGHR